MVNAPNGTSHVANGVRGSFLFTSESVGEGHPDKIASVTPNLLWPERIFNRCEIGNDGAIADVYGLRSDQVSDAVLDACLAEDPLSKVRMVVVDIPTMAGLMYMLHDEGCLRDGYENR